MAHSQQQRAEKPAEKPPRNYETEPMTYDERVVEVRVLLGKTLRAIERALPKGSLTDPERFAQLAMTVILTDYVNQKDKDKALLWCNDFSIQRCIVQAAELDLQPGSALGQAWFIPYNYEATFQVGVWGYVALMRRSDNVSEVWADVIYENDKYKVVRGAHRDLQHEIDPRMTRAQRGAVLGAYACVKYVNGSVDWEFVNAEDLALARETSKAPNSPAHVKWPDEMSKRTAIKRLAKYAEKAVIVNRAAELDESEVLRDDLMEALKVVTVQGQEITKQKSTLDAIVKALPANVTGLSASEQVGAPRQGAEVANK